MTATSGLSDAQTRGLRAVYDHQLASPSSAGIRSGRSTTAVTVRTSIVTALWLRGLIVATTPGRYRLTDAGLELATLMFTVGDQPELGPL